MGNKFPAVTAQPTCRRLLNPSAQVPHAWLLVVKTAPPPLLGMGSCPSLHSILRGNVNVQSCWVALNVVHRLSFSRLCLDQPHRFSEQLRTSKWFWQSLSGSRGERPTVLIKDLPKP